jgi:hypothetical protein
MIKRIWLYPPLAFARVGSASTPCENFYWGPDDLTPDGTARTRIVAAETLKVAEDGTVTAHPRVATDSVIFKDNEGFRPVCPFFEVHAAWESDSGEKGEGPLTEALLERFKLSADKLKWRVDVFNLKAFHLTDSEGDRIAASVEILAGDFGRHRLEGRSIGKQPLVPPGTHIPLGTVQATRRAGDFLEFRLRFTPASGKVYAPTDLADRVAKLEQPKVPITGIEAAYAEIAKGGDPKAVFRDFMLVNNLVWQDFKLPADQCLLNPAAEWPKYNLIGVDDLLAQLPNLLPRFADVKALSGHGDRSELLRALLGPYKNVGNLPPSLFAFVAEPPNILASLGMVDDMGDGTISVELDDLKATSRIVIAPPMYAPDRRLPVSLADGLADRVDRASVRDPQWVEGRNRVDADAEVHDLLDRAYETAGLQNVDAAADFLRQENSNRALRRDSPLTPQQAAELLWRTDKVTSVHTLPLAALAWQRHRRNTTRLFFENFVRETKGWFGRWIRPPADPQKFYDKRMPGLMRGFDRHPLHLTRRQYELLKAWAKRGPRS